MGIHKVLKCDKFFKWVNDDNEIEKRIMMMLTEITKELSELRILYKLIKKGQSIVFMLLIAIIVALAIAMLV